MGRSGYSDDLGNTELNVWRGAVASAMRGKRGQQFFKDLIAALDAMPEKRLIINELECAEGVCALGALGKARGVDMTNLEPTEPSEVAEAFNIASALAQETVFENDEAGASKETPEHRWERMRRWAVRNLKPENPSSTPEQCAQ